MRAELAGRYRPALWLVLSLIWAAVMVDTGDVAWPLAMWLTTTFIPLTALDHRRELGEQR